MTKNYFLSLLSLLPFYAVFAQAIPKAQSINQLTKEAQIKPQRPGINKAFGDTLHYEDFSTGSTNSLPQGWSVNDNLTVQTWRWSTSAPGGQYTTVGPLNSTSASNGFMSLPLDSINTPAPAAGFQNIAAELTSSTIVISPRSSVYLSFETALRYCCSQSSVDMILQVSTDSINWDTYDASNGINPSMSLNNATKVDVNITQTAALADTLYLRYKMSGASHFYWMIDDVVLYEGYENQWYMTNYSVEFTNNFQVNPVFTIMPYQLMPPLDFQVSTYNESNTRTNAYVDLEVFQDSTWQGGAGSGLVFSDSTLVGNVIPSSQFDTVDVGPYFNVLDGHFRAELTLVSDSPNFQARSRATYPFAVSDTVLAKDRNAFNGRIGVGSYINPITQSPGGNQGDMMLTVISIVGTDSVLATSLSFYVGNNAANDGVQIVPVIYQFVGAPPLPPSPSNLIAQNLNPTTIDTTMFDSWITIDFASGGGTGNVWLQAGQQYAIGWRQENGGNGEAFFAGRAFNMEQYQPNLSNFVNFQGNTWSWVTAQPAVRLNFGNLFLPTSINEQIQKAVSFEVKPNPNNGLFTVSAESSVSERYMLVVRNTLGETVYTENLAFKGQLVKNMNLNHLDKGVYFLSLENEQDRYVKKIVLH